MAQQVSAADETRILDTIRQRVQRFMRHNKGIAETRRVVQEERDGDLRLLRRTTMKRVQIL